MPDRPPHSSGLARAASRGREAAATVASTARSSLDAADQVRSTASEIVRVRRDPSATALRRHAAARRRVQVWGAGTVVGVAGTAASITTWVTAGFSAAVIFYLLLALAVLGYCLTGAVRATRDLRQRRRVVTSLPPPQPDRRPVDRALTARVAQLGAYSDSLRQLIGLVGLVDDASMRSLRGDVIGAADAAELRLRRLADQLTVLLRAQRSGPAAARSGPAGLDATVATLTQQLSAGVEQYGELVAAASESALASRATPVVDPTLPEATSRLLALAGGLRALSNE